jgi:hypothetical protein
VSFSGLLYGEGCELNMEVACGHVRLATSKRRAYSGSSPGDAGVFVFMLVVVSAGYVLVLTNGRWAWYEAGSCPMVLCF